MSKPKLAFFGGLLAVLLGLHAPVQAQPHPTNATKASTLAPQPLAGAAKFYADAASICAIVEGANGIVAKAMRRANGFEAYTSARDGHDLMIRLPRLQVPPDLSATPDAKALAEAVNFSVSSRAAFFAATMDYIDAPKVSAEVKVREKLERAQFHLAKAKALLQHAQSGRARP